MHVCILKYKAEWSLLLFSYQITPHRNVILVERVFLSFVHLDQGCVKHLPAINHMKPKSKIPFLICKIKVVSLKS